MNLPTEEDVLAILVLRAARPLVANIDNTDQWLNLLRWDQATEGVPQALVFLAQERINVAQVNHPWDALRAAIADSERRLEVERAARCVVEMAECWADAHSNPGDAVHHLEGAVRRMLAARRALEGK